MVRPFGPPGSGFAGPSPEKCASTRPLPGADVTDVKSSTPLRSRPPRVRAIATQKKSHVQQSRPLPRFESLSLENV